MLSPPQKKISSETWEQVKQELYQQAKKLDILAIGVSSAQRSSRFKQYEEWITAGYHGDMHYLARPDRLARRRNPEIILAQIKVIISVLMAYWPKQFPEADQDPRYGRISCYAWGFDYHDLLASKLKHLSQWLVDNIGGQAVYYVDTGAIQERDLAACANLGFIGKNTMLIHPRYGSGVFIGQILSTQPIPIDPPKSMPNCGNCRNCLDACPTGALIEPYILDSRRCISYLTIELKDEIPDNFRSKIANHIYGCDICQRVCPWNRFAHNHSSLSEISIPITPLLKDLIQIDNSDFDRLFHNSPIHRIKRSRLLRNVAIAIGNSGDKQAIPILHQAHRDPDPLIQTHTAWALQKLHFAS
jgi:epoxyqueuosine reductase